MPLKKSARGPKKEGMGETPTPRETHHVKNSSRKLKLPKQETKVCGIATQVRHFSQQCGHGHAAFASGTHKNPSPAQPNSCGFGGLQIENGLIQGNLTYVFFLHS